MNLTPSPRPSVRSANWLYLLTMALIITLGSFVQARSLSWGLLATELFLILLPTLLFLWLKRLPARAVLQLCWPGWRLIGLGALIGAGVWGLDIALSALASAVLGYSPNAGATSLATDPLNLTIFVLAMTVAAPLCEETLFRGYLLSAYGRYRPLVRVLAVAALFAVYHLQFQGLFALLPVALALTVLAQRSRSLWPGIAAHMANNAFGAVVVVSRAVDPTLPAQPLFTGLLCGFMAAGPLVALGALAVFWRLTRPPAGSAPSEPGPLPEPPAPVRPARGTWWPLAGAAVLYVALAGLEVVLGRFPQVLAQSELALEPAPWNEPVLLTYNLWNVENKQVGSVACAFTPEGATIAFHCSSRQQHFEARQGNSTWAGGTYTLEQTGHWDAATLRLLDAELNFQGEFSGWTARVGPGADPAQALNLWLGEAAPVSVPAGAVLAAEWPFRFMALPLGGSGYFGSRFDEVLLGVGQETGAVESAAVLVGGEEVLPTPPDGQQDAWKVTVGQQTAWYAATVPHTLLRYNDGFGVTWTVDLNSLPDSGN